MSRCDDNSRTPTGLPNECIKAEFGCVPVTTGEPVYIPKPDQLPFAKEMGCNDDVVALWVYVCDHGWCKLDPSLCRLKPVNIDVLANKCQDLKIPVIFNIEGCCVEGHVDLQELAEEVWDCLDIDIPEIPTFPTACELIATLDDVDPAPAGPRVVPFGGTFKVLSKDPCGFEELQLPANPVDVQCSGNRLVINGQSVGLATSGAGAAWNLQNAQSINGSQPVGTELILVSNVPFVIPDNGCGTMTITVGHWYHTLSQILSTGFMRVVSEISFDNGVTWQSAGSSGAVHATDTEFLDHNWTGLRNIVVAPGPHTLAFRARLDSSAVVDVGDLVPFNQGRVQMSWPTICCGAAAAAALLRAGVEDDGTVATAREAVDILAALSELRHYHDPVSNSTYQLEGLIEPQATWEQVTEKERIDIEDQAFMQYFKKKSAEIAAAKA